MHRILVADSLGSAGVELLRAAGCTVDLLGDQDRPRLPELIGDYDALLVRSATKVDERVLRAARRLRVVGRAGIGVDNIDLKTATELGVLVVNAPTANLLSATEHTFALLLSVMRRVPAADAAMKRGQWDRKSFVGQELQGKVLGIIGFGQIGQRVAQRARAFEMVVLAHDPFLNQDVARQHEVELVELEVLLARADVVTLHTPLTDQTRGLLDRERIGRMKDGAVIVNCGRGGTIDEAALLEALESGKLQGAGLDVFEQEPPPDFALAQHPRVVATPHLGASTREAEELASTDTANHVLAALAGSLAVSAVNLPFRPAGSRAEPYLRLAERLGRLASCVLGEPLRRVEVHHWSLEDSMAAPVGVAVLKGALVPFLGEAVNYVNAERQASSRGIEVVHSRHTEPSDWSHLVGVRVHGASADAEVAGTLYGERDPRCVRFLGFQLEFRPSGRLLVVRNRDVPGVVGKLGTLLGDAAINIAEIHLARLPSADALAVLRLDQEPSRAVLDRIRSMPEVRQVSVFDLGEL